MVSGHVTQPLPARMYPTHPAAGMTPVTRIFNRRCNTASWYSILIACMTCMPPSLALPAFAPRSTGHRPLTPVRHAYKDCMHRPACYSHWPSARPSPVRILLQTWPTTTRGTSTNWTTTCRMEWGEQGGGRRPACPVHRRALCRVGYTAHGPLWDSHNGSAAKEYVVKGNEGQEGTGRVHRPVEDAHLRLPLCLQPGRAAACCSCSPFPWCITPAPFHSLTVSLQAAGRQGPQGRGGGDHHVRQHAVGRAAAVLRVRAGTGKATGTGVRRHAETSD